MRITDEQLWKNARLYSEQVGKIPISFSTAVRTLKLNYNKNFESGKSGYNSESKFQTVRLLKSKSVLAPFFFATMTLYQEELKGKTGLTAEQILEFHNPSIAANFLSLLYYSRKIKKLCIPEAWVWLEKRVQEFSDIGILLGRSVSAIGPADGVIMGTMRHLSLGLFMAADNKKFQAYKRHLKDKKQSFDLQKEIELFECSHSYVGSILLQLMGFGVDYANAYSLALNSRHTDKLIALAGKLRLTALYIEALYTGQEPPSLPEEHDYEISDHNMDILVDASERIRDEGSEFSWLLKKKEHLTRAATPQLLLEEAAPDEPEIDLEKESEESTK